MSFKRTLVVLIAIIMPVGFSHAFTPVHASRAYKPTVKTWTEVYEHLTKDDNSIKGTTYIGPLKGNGYIDRRHKNNARDTIVFIPTCTNFKQPIDIIFYFHGLGGFKKRDFGTRVLEHTTLIDPTKNYVIVIPEMPWSKNTSTPRTRQGRVFTKKGAFGTFVGGVRDILREHFHPKCNKEQCPVSPPHILGDITLLGHSAGGSTLMSISRSGGLNWLHNSAKALSVKVIFSDASYGRWLDITWKYFNPRVWGTEFLILTRKWDRPYNNMRRFLKRFKKTPTNVRHVVFNRHVTHSEIGDRSFGWVYDFETSGCGEGDKNEL
jgi:hypothetical protein